MSLFDKPKPVLNPILWTPEQTLRPEAKGLFFNLLSKIFPLNKIQAMVMIGSSVGYQYSETSDIDINVMAVKGEDYDKWHEIFKTFYDKNLYPGTQHMINFFFQEYAEGEDWNNSLGAYDILHGIWLKRPIPYDKIKDPYKKYEKELSYGHMLLSMIDSEVEAIRRSVAAGNQLDVDNRIQRLADIFSKIDLDRKTAYRYHTGTPALQENNILYKLISDSKYKDLFHELVERYNTTSDLSRWRAQ